MGISSFFVIIPEEGQPGNFSLGISAFPHEAQPGNSSFLTLFLREVEPESFFFFILTRFSS